MIKFEDLRPAMVIDTVAAGHIAILEKTKNSVSAVYLDNGSINDSIGRKLWEGIFEGVAKKGHPKEFITAIFENEHVAQRLYENWLSKK